jgi:hypothetical protein
MSANLATSSWTTGLCSQNPPITAELMPPMRWALDLGLHGRGHHTSEYLCVHGGRGCVPLLLHCLGRAAFCPCSPVQVPSGGVPAYAEGD